MAIAEGDSKCGGHGEARIFLVSVTPESGCSVQIFFACMRAEISAASSAVLDLFAEPWPVPVVVPARAGKFNHLAIHVIDLNCIGSNICNAMHRPFL